MLNTSEAIPAKKRPTKKLFNKKMVPYLLLMPAFIFYALFWLVPVLQGMKEVFTDLEGNFTLTENFRMMFESDLFMQALVNTGIFVLISVTIQFLIALVLAVFLSRKFRGSRILLFIAMIPMAITPTAVAIIWKSGLLSDGWINSLLMQFQITSEQIMFLNAEGASALFLIILMDTWVVTASVMIILMAGLQNVQVELKESAYLFGASKWRIFKDIVLPIMKPSIITAILLRLIAAIQIWSIAVMVFGYGKVPFLVERIAYYVEVVPGLETSEKLAYTISFTTTILVLIASVAYLIISRKGSKSGGMS